MAEPRMFNFGERISEVADPEDPQDSVTKSYADAQDEAVRAYADTLDEATRSYVDAQDQTTTADLATVMYVDDRDVAYKNYEDGLHSAMNAEVATVADLAAQAYTAAHDAPVLTAPDDSEWRIVVANDGTLSTEPA